MRADLHCHSTASDGAYPPDEVVRIALTHQLDVIALADHDSVSGIEAARRAAAGTPLEVLSAMELSSEDETADRHILGYLVDIQNPRLVALLAGLRQSRVRRVEKMAEKLAALGLPISVERIIEVGGGTTGGSLGRPHVARVMIESGYVSSREEAFAKFLGDGKPAYVPHNRLTPTEAIDVIHAAGGVAVLAHPGRYGNYRPIIDGLVPCGLDGIEMYYPDHTPDIVDDLRVIARQYNLVMTVGSDFHRREGDGSARIGSVKYPADLDPVGMLKARAAQYSA